MQGRTLGRRPGTKLNGSPTAIMPNATSFELAGKTGSKIRVEKYITEYQVMSPVKTTGEEKFNYLEICLMLAVRK